jgi:shikimate kinase
MNERGHAIVLIGFMGAGKSSVGRMLAALTGLPRFDTDEMVGQRFGCTISQIFETYGEGTFREAETETLGTLSGKGRAIIVTGGGIVTRPENVALLRQLGTVVLLAADEQTLFGRISRRTSRPLLRTENPRGTVTALLEKRLPLYRDAADVEVDTSTRTHEEVANLILEKIERYDGRRD